MVKNVSVIAPEGMINGWFKDILHDTLGYEFPPPLRMPQTKSLESLDTSPNLLTVWTTPSKKTLHASTKKWLKRTAYQSKKQSITQTEQRQEWLVVWIYVSIPLKSHRPIWDHHLKQEWISRISQRMRSPPSHTGWKNLILSYPFHFQDTKFQDYV